MLSIKNKFIAAATLLSVISLGTASINTPSADAAVVVQTSAAGTLIAHRDRDRDDHYDNDDDNDDRYEQRSNHGRHRGQYRKNHRDGYYGRYNNRHPREIYSNSSHPGVVIYNPQPRYPRGHSCVRTLYATICN
jgi:hypothetical protein